MKIPESFAWLQIHGSEALWLGPESTTFIILMTCNLTWQKIKWLQLQLGLGSSRLLTWLGALLALTKDGTWIDAWSKLLDSDVCLNLLTAEDMEIAAPRFQLWWIQRSFDSLSWKLETFLRLSSAAVSLPPIVSNLPCPQLSSGDGAFTEAYLLPSHPHWRHLNWFPETFSPEKLITMSVKSFRVLCFCSDVMLAGNVAQTCLWKWSTSTPTCCHI